MGLLGFQRTRDLLKPHSVHHSGQFHQGPETMVEKASTGKPVAWKAPVVTRESKPLLKLDLGTCASASIAWILKGADVTATS